MGGPARSKKRDEMHSFRTAMKYAWVMRTGNDGKGEMMVAWHSKYHKYVRRPSETPFAAKKKLEKKANRKTNKSRGRERTSPARQLRSCLSNHGCLSRRRPRSNDKNPGRHPRPHSFLKIWRLVQGSTTFERSKPRRYSKPDSSKYQYSSRDRLKPQDSEEKTGEKPSVYRSKGKRALHKLAKKDQKYGKHKSKSFIDWTSDREFGTSTLDLKEVAQIHPGQVQA